MERDLFDRLLVGVPGAAAGAAWSLRRLQPGSALRRRAVHEMVRRGFAAMARSDIEQVLLNYEPDAEVWMNGLAGVGIDGCYRGHDAVRGLYADFDDAFSDWAWTPREVVDGGERVAIRADFVAYGRTSGARTEIRNGGSAVRFSNRGLVAWQEWFGEDAGWEKALRSAGLDQRV